MITKQGLDHKQSKILHLSALECCSEFSGRSWADVDWEGEHDYEHEHERDGRAINHSAILPGHGKMTSVFPINPTGRSIRMAINPSTPSGWRSSSSTACRDTGLDASTCALLRQPLRSTTSASRCAWNDGTINVFQGFRVQHNDAPRPLQGRDPLSPAGKHRHGGRALAMWMTGSARLWTSRWAAGKAA